MTIDFSSLRYKSPQDMETEELKECHRRMWQHLADYPWKVKSDWFVDFDLNVHEEGLLSYYFCYACLSATRTLTGVDKRQGLQRCVYCPCTWVDRNCPCTWVDRKLSKSEQGHFPCEFLEGSSYRAWRQLRIRGIWRVSEQEFVWACGKSALETSAKYALAVRDAWK
jgi:hypothetical protein